MKLELFLLGLLCVSVAAEPALRPLNFIVAPSTGPVAEVLVRNLGGGALSSMLQAIYPAGWSTAPAQLAVKLDAGQEAYFSFALESGKDLQANVYPVKLRLEAGGKTVEKEFEVVCASTPFYKPVIDGKLDEWADAIPVSFTSGGMTTVVRTYWNNSVYCLAVEVEEENLIGLKKADTKTGMDAIQFALAPGKSKTAAINEPAVRHEFLLADSGSRWGKDRIFVLKRPGDSLKDSAEKRKLEPLALETAEVKVVRDGNTTIYEAALPMKAMKDLRATAGREYCFSLLVHDADGTRRSS